MKKFKIKNIKAELLEGLQSMVDDEIVGISPLNDEEAVLYAVLRQISEKIYTKLGNWQKQYSISLTPAEAFAMRIFFNDYINDRSTYMGNQLGKISDEVHQFYQ